MESFPNIESENKQENPERHEAVGRLKEYLASEQVKISEELETLQEGKNPQNRITVSRDLRIEPPPAQYIEKDQQFVEKVVTQSYGTSDAARVESKQESQEGFQFELLKTAIMHKYAGERFMTLRSSEYDDIANHIDNVLVDRVTGEPICALDEVTATKITGSERYDEKVDKITRSNLGLSKSNQQEVSSRERFGPGARLKYGLQIREGKLECKEMNNLPLFLLTVDREHLREGLKNFNPEGEDEYSKKMYTYFLSAMNYQIDRISLFEKEFAALPPEMRKRILNFKGFLDKEMKSK